MTKREQLANVFYGKQPDDPITEDVQVLVDALNSICTEEQADAALLAPWQQDLRWAKNKPLSCKEIAAKAGRDPEELEKLLDECGRIGLIEKTYGENGEYLYAHPTTFPGLAEAIMTTTPTKEGAYWYHYFAANMSKQGILANMPVGFGNLRALPVRESIDTNSQIMSFEEIEPYIEKSKYISVSNCPCRTAYKTLGMGCGHTNIDTCIQLGHYAETYLLTGRARPITKQEVYDILRRCEREGLVHQVAAYGAGNEAGAFVCNCCGDSCVLLRNANIMNMTEPFRSNFVAEINPDNCVGCGACVENCNTNALSLGSCHSKTAPVIPEHPDPAETAWGEQYWNKDWNKRIMVNEQGTSPCKTFCPAHISVQGYIKKAGEGKYADALKVIKRDNPFPAVCGRVCPHNCETECTRNVVDEAIAIDDIKKFVADKELDSEFRYVPSIGDRHPQHIAVIGGGPAGLSCAYYSAVNGFHVTVFEKEKVLGGMLTLGIPSFRLEKDVVNAEIDVLRELGVTFRTGVEVGKDVTIEDLRKEGFDAFYIAIGAQAGRKLGVEGEDAEGVVSGVDFLRSVNLGEGGKLSGKTVVVGGGNVAIDVARTSVRMGSSETAMFCLESKEEMPALPEEQEEAKAEGVTINNGWGPKRILTKDGRVVGVEFKRCVSVFDENKKFSPKYDENDVMTVECDNVISSIGQSIVWGDLLKGTEAAVTGRNTLDVDGFTLQSSQENIFGGGDVITGPKFAIDAIAAGKSGAISLKRYLLGDNLTIKREREYHPLDKENLDLSGYDSMPRQRVSRTNPDQAKKTLKDMRGELTEEQVKKEAKRCLGCGITVVNPDRCIGCGVCATKCEFEGISLKRRTSNVPPATKAEYAKELQEYAVNRQKKLMAKQAAASGKTE